MSLTSGLPMYEWTCPNCGVWVSSARLPVLGAAHTFTVAEQVAAGEPPGDVAIDPPHEAEALDVATLAQVLCENMQSRHHHAHQPDLWCSKHYLQAARFAAEYARLELEA